jgi:hypothetical protein
MKSKILSIFLLFALIGSCVDESNEVYDSNENPDSLLQASQKIDPRAAVYINQNDLNASELFNTYKDLSDIEDEYVKLNSKNLILFYLHSLEFEKTASLDDIEYLIKDQSSLKSNLLTLEINFQLFNYALDLNSNLNIQQIYDDFLEKNNGAVDAGFLQSDFRKQEYYLSSTLLQARLNLES